MCNRAFPPHMLVFLSRFCCCQKAPFVFVRPTFARWLRLLIYNLTGQEPKKYHRVTNLYIIPFLCRIAATNRYNHSGTGRCRNRNISEISYEITVGRGNGELRCNYRLFSFVKQTLNPFFAHGNKFLLWKLL